MPPKFEPLDPDTSEVVFDKLKLVIAAVIITVFIFMLPGAYHALQQLSQPLPPLP